MKKLKNTYQDEMLNSRQVLCIKKEILTIWKIGKFVPHTYSVNTVRTRSEKKGLLDI